MNQEERLRAFRASYPNKSLAAAAVEWKYRICGAGTRALLMLPGGELVNDMGFDLVAALAPRFRIVYPAYPRVESLDDLADGIATILNAENIDRKSTRLNSSHLVISYAVFCLKKTKNFANLGYNLVSHTIASRPFFIDEP